MSLFNKLKLQTLVEVVDNAEGSVVSRVFCVTETDESYRMIQNDSRFPEFYTFQLLLSDI